MKPLSLKDTVLRVGFSLIEMLMAVAVISTLGAGAVLTINNVAAASKSTKLQRDVKVVNSAIRVYMLNGGTFLQSDLQNPATVLAKLKKRATAQREKELAGLRHSMIDERLAFEMQSGDEAADGSERARFIADPANPRFEIQTSGPPGIRRFIIDTNLATVDHGTEDRIASMKLATRDQWVWDYSESALREDYPAPPPSANPMVMNSNPSDAGNLALNPPGFSIPSGTAPLNDYPRSLALMPTNPAGSSEIRYSINGAPFVTYGGPFNVDPGMTVTGISVSLDSDRYDDSLSASNTYLVTPLTPLPSVTFGAPSFTYFELGGQAATGTPPPLPSGSVKGAGAILNMQLIPGQYRNSSVFRFVWTSDGSNPLTSTTAGRQADFAGGFETTPIPVPLSAFGTATSITMQTAVKAENEALVNNSAVESHILSARSLQLRTPNISKDGREVTLSLDLASRDTPADVRIFYTTDGTDPGVDDAGNPLRGALYTGTAFTLGGPTGESATVQARAYAPVGFRQFFSASEAGVMTTALPARTDVFVGGSFVNPQGNPMRNIARLGNSGQLDMSFDTGTGAAPDSLIGIVRQNATGVMAGGDFETMNGAPHQGLVRLNPDGSVDNTFNAALTAD